MAAVDFGDSELFEQLGDTLPVPTHIRFTDDESIEETSCHVRDRLEECEEIIQRLTDENLSLNRKLRILTRPSGLTVEDVNLDGPLLQILYANNAISKQCRQEIEDCICSVIQKHQNQGKQNTSFHMTPQNSAFVMEEDQKTKSSSCIKKMTEVFSMVGSVMYFTTFSVDKLGQPLLNENPQLTEGWEVPTYEQIFKLVIGTDGQDIEMKDRRPKPSCFNCGLGGHQLRDCPKPKDMAAINERRKEFGQNSNQTNQGNQRYHAEVEERFAKYKPGVLSEELLAALGVDGNTLPPLVYRMRQLGYPPGWLKEAELENSGLALYDGKGAVEDGASGQTISYDVTKLVDFPGFNIPAPPKMKDEFMQYGSVPMQNSHMKHNFAAYLSSNYPEPGAICNKRRQDSGSSSQERKKRRSSPRSSDMELDSDLDTSGFYPSPQGFQFQPPLPPGSPAFSSPPPLPQGTPPATPTPPPLPKGTPPATPSNRSPALRGSTWKLVDESNDVEEELTLEELEEQQRIIMAALENADTATNSDCETPALGTPVPSSPSISTSAHVDTESEMEEHEPEEVPQTKGSTEAVCQNSEEQTKAHVSTSPGPVCAQEDSPHNPGPVKAEEDSPHSPGPVQAEEDSPGPVQAEEDSPHSPGPIKVEEDSPQSPGPVKVEEDSPQSPGPILVQEDVLKNPGPIGDKEDKPQSPGPILFEEVSPGSPVPELPTQEGVDDISEKVMAVPHRSRFAAGIVPFEDTPEFTEVAEATGTYLKIRDVLKCSPRNLAKSKK